MADHLIEASWIEFFERCIAPDTPEDLVGELRLAFYAGAARMHRMLSRDPSLGPAMRAEINEVRAELRTMENDDG